MSNLSPVSTSCSRKGGAETLARLPLKNDVVPILYPTFLVKSGNGAAEAILLCGIRRGHDLPANCCIAEKLGLFRHHVLFRTVVALVVYGERRRVSLGKDRGIIPKQNWEGMRVKKGS